VTAATPRRQPAPVRREQVLAAAEQVLLERGLRNTTMADVAEAAGLAKGTLYLHFESKDDLLAGLRRRYIEAIEADLQVRVAKATTGEEQIAALVHGLVDATARRHDLHHLLFHEAGFSEEDAFAPVRAAFAKAIEDGGFAVADPALATDYVLGGVHAALVSATHSAAPKRRKVADEIATLAVRSLS
jgi:AcrR family transcriptional regulator